MLTLDLLRTNELQSTVIAYRDHIKMCYFWASFGKSVGENFHADQATPVSVLLDQK